MCVNGDGCVEEKKGKTKEEADGQHQGQLEREKDKEEKKRAVWKRLVSNIYPTLKV